jgi:hypothetical protein
VSSQLETVTAARAGFERWVDSLNSEFKAFRAGNRSTAIAGSLGTGRDLRKS